MRDRNYKCPVCGAPVDGDKCEYCGCVIYDFANIDFENPSYIRMKLGGNYITMKAIAVNPSITISSDNLYQTDGRGNTIGTIRGNKTMEVDLKLVDKRII